MDKAEEQGRILVQASVEFMGVARAQDRIAIRVTGAFGIVLSVHDA